MAFTKSLQFMLTPLFWYGLWPHRNPSPYYWYMTVFTYTIHGVCLVLMLTNFIKYYDNDDAAKSVCILLTAFMTFFKVHNLVAKRKEIQYLVDQIINDFQFNSVIANNQNAHESTLIRHGIGTIVKVTKIFFTLNFSTLMIMFAVPLFANSAILPFPSWYPCNWKQNLGCFWVVYVYQVVTIAFMESPITALMDVFPNLLLSLIETQIDIISWQMVNIGERNTENEAMERNEMNRYMTDKCIAFVKNHRRIISLCTLWEKCFSNVLFVQIFISSLVLCANAYELSKTNLFEDPENFVKFAMYAGIMVLEIFLPCYFGSRINDKTSYLRQKVFESQWVDASLEYKKLLVIFLERGKRPIKINLYGFFFLRLETFSSVCSFAYRLFTVVKQQK